MSEPRRPGDAIAIAGDYQYRALHAGWAPQRFWHRARLDEALRQLAPAAGERIVDAGCGSGLLAERLLGAGAHVVGVDANPAAVAFAAARFGGPRAQFRLGQLDALPLDEPPHKIALLEVIEHLPRAQALAVLRHFAALLRPGGRVVVSTPNARSAWPLVEWLLDRTRLVAPLAEEQHVASYDARRLSRLAAEAGLRVTALRTLHLAAPWLAWLSWRAAERVHALEQAARPRFGALLVATLEAP